MEYYDTDSIKVTSLTEEEFITAKKLFLNSLYGKMSSCIHFTDGKENNMREFIVVHDHDDPVIILKDAVIAVKNERETEETCVYLSDGFIIRCTDKYRDIVKALIK